MLKRIKRTLAIVLSFMSVVALYGNAGMALAYTPKTLQAASATLSDPRTGVGAEYAFSMQVGTNGAVGLVKGVKMNFRTSASNAVNFPAGMNYESATIKPASIGGLDTGNGTWSVDTTYAANGEVIIKNAGATTSPASGGTISWTLSGMTNPVISDEASTGCHTNPTNSNSGTCFIQVRTYDTDDKDLIHGEDETQLATGTTTHLVDYTTITYTVVSPVTVTASVDPSFSFAVTGVASGQGTALAGTPSTTTSNTSTATTLPFSYVSPGTPKYLAQDLQVITNTVSGYTVYVNLRSQMVGTYAGNDIDPFTGNDGNATWNAPEAFAVPDGTHTTPNTNTGWIGAHSDNVGAQHVDFDNQYWPLKDNAADMTKGVVMTQTTPDAGTTKTRVAYALGVNVFQPADSYTGQLEYNAVPQY